ncbi:hypothetical protein [Williamsia sp. DF01-3]|nr:hypothetical protein [Williamsia sp. DF01-3]
MGTSLRFEDRGFKDVVGSRGSSEGDGERRPADRDVVDELVLVAGR